MGAIVAVEMAVQAPERIVGLVLSGYNATADLPERAAHRPAQQSEVRAGGLERVLVEELKPNYLAAQNRKDNSLLRLLRDMGMDLGADVFVRQSEALRLRGDRREAIAALHMPVLYLCGEEDTLCPPAWHQIWTNLTPKSQFKEISGAGHMLPLEAPTAFAATIENWLTINEKEFA
jgi:pimeloyl-ACP methyl ester carboxylesterase